MLWNLLKLDVLWIGEYCVREIPVPRAVAEEPVTSRFLDVLEKKLGKKIYVSEYAQLCGAIGAALLARD